MNSLSQENRNQIRGEEVQRVDGISGERRSDKRYGMQLQVRWKLLRRRRTIENGTGHTIDMSSGGILFEAGANLPEGLNVELSIAWPMLLHNLKPMQLIVTGRIVRAQNGAAAIRTLTHEFRTVGIATEQQRGLTVDSSNRGGMMIQREHNISHSGTRN
jgi:c-di-GMP-binding flagellar brake protein YcgR